MALVKLDTGVPMFRTSRTGDCFYVRNGKQLVRQVVKPCYPRTTRQLKDVSGITAASKAWRNLMTPEQQGTWGFPCEWGWWGSPWLQAIWSILWWIFDEIGPLEFTGECPPPICADGICVSADDGTFYVTVEGDPASSLRGYVSAGPPMSLGRVPRLEMTRLLAAAVVPGTVVDIGEAYVAAFGRLPVAGSVGIATRFADLATGTSTDVCFRVFEVGCDGVLCEAVCVPNPMTTFTAGTVTATATFDDGTTTWGAVNVMPAEFDGGTALMGIGNGVSGDFFINDFGGVPGTYDCHVDFTSEQTGATCRADYVVEVIPL